MKDKIIAINPFLFYLPLTLLFVFLYYPTFIWLYERYVSADSYYSHGFLVPLISGFLIWLKRRELKKCKRKYNVLGLVLIVFSLLLHSASMLAEVFFVSGFSILSLVFGVSLFLFGKEITKKILFPLFFLIFMFPLPLLAVNAISFPMKMFVTKVVVFILKTLLNLPIRNEGFQIFLPTGSLVVENPCSGLRSLIVMLALGSIFAYFLRASTTKKISLFLLSIPIALVSNISRVILLSLGVYIYGSHITNKYLHDFSGYLMFAIAFIGLWLSWRFLQCESSE